MLPVVTTIERTPAGRVQVTLPRMFISGLTYANNAADAVNDIDIAAGACRSDDDSEDLILPSTITKQTDAVFQPGNNAGGVDLTASLGNNDLYMWKIGRGGRRPVTDILFSLSSTAPTVPPGFPKKRLMGWVKRAGGTVVAFHTYEIFGGGLQFAWDVPTTDVNLAATLTTARRADAVKVPLNFSTIANVTVAVSDAAASSFARVMCPDETDAAVSAANANLSIQVANQLDAKDFKIRTSATGTIAARANIATIDTYTIQTNGFDWARRN